MAKKMKAWIKTIRQLFSSEELTRLARKVGFIQRQRSLTAEAFLTLCAWGDGSLACQSLQRLCADLALWHDCSLSNEGLNQRFTPRAVAFLKEVFFTLLMHQRPALSSITETYRACFTRLRILDSTSFLLPADYGEDYQGSVSSAPKSNLSMSCYREPVFSCASNRPMIPMPALLIIPSTRFYRMTFAFGIWGFFHSPRWRRSMPEVLIILPGCVPISKSISNRTGSGTNGIGNR